LTSAAQTLTVTLVPSDYNGFAVSCFGEKDGTLTAVVSGGTPPYQIGWSTGEEGSLTITGLPSGYYNVKVADDAGESAYVEIMLMEPYPLKVDLTPVVYPNDYNISCWECHNGIIYVDTDGGVGPFSSVWEDGMTGMMRMGLGAKGHYSTMVTDANGCVARTQQINLTQPERNDWGMSGNTGSNPAINYIGTADAKDVVFKSNGQERLRLLASGSIRLADPTLEPGPLHLDADGVLRNGLLIQVPREPVTPCMDGLWPLDNWRSDGNHFGYPQCDPNDIPLLGTHTPHPISVITGGIERMHISTNGKVGIGTLPPGGALDGYRLFVEDGIATRDVMVKLGTWPDYVFADGYRLMPMSELRAFVQRNSHLPHVPSAKELEEKGGVPLGDLAHQLTRTIEEQTLYILQLEERAAKAEEHLARMEHRLSTLEAAK
jgi:hypothetical protein